VIEVRWSDPALDDIEAIRDYIAKDSPFYARRFIERVFEHVEKLNDFPMMGRLVPEAEDRKDIRELIYQGYRIIYLLTSDLAEIITVVHGSRDLLKKDKPWGE
jgi:addiction module RelE/StbE family toxin